MRYGYARVSSTDQSLNLQIDALRKAECDRVFTDHGISGVDPNRPGLSDLMRIVQPGDTIIVWRLDRIGRSMRDLVDRMHALHRRGIGFVSLCESIDMDSAVGELILHLLIAISHFERRLIIERTRAGLAAAKARGVQLGRPPALNGEERCEALSLINAGLSIPETAAELSIGRSTLYRYIAELRSASCNQTPQGEIGLLM